MLNKWPCGGTSGTHISDWTPSDLQRSKQNDLVDQPQFSPSFAKVNSRRLLKRPRPDENIEGEGEEVVQRKKRRLRINLVTSRLSRPYADPATHIVGTKAWRDGAWARQRFIGGKLLRKAAVLNCIAMKRKDVPSEKGRMSELFAGNVNPRLYPDEFDTKSFQQDRSSSIMPPPTSDYDAFDYEDDDIEQEEGDQSSDEDGQVIHSDFRLLEPSDTDPEFFDTSWSFMTTGEPKLDPSGNEIKLVIENESKDEVSFAPDRSRDFPP